MGKVAELGAKAMPTLPARGMIPLLAYPYGAAAWGERAQVYTVA